MSRNPLRQRRVVDVFRFFPAFCKNLAKHGFATVFVYDEQSIMQNIVNSSGRTVLVNLVRERDARIDSYDFSSELLEKIDIVFNTCHLARIVGDKQSTNEFLSAQGVPMPKCNVDGRDYKGLIFSFSRIGRNRSAYIVDNAGTADDSRYNTEFVNTIVEFKDRSYYTSIRLMCVGPHILKILVRARDSAEQCPECRDHNTPRDRELFQHLHESLVFPNLDSLSSLAEQCESAYGPGFYAHDVLIEQPTARVLLCETELKFFPTAFMKRFHGFLDDANTLVSTCNQSAYSKHAAYQFMNYCNQIFSTGDRLANAAQQMYSR